MTYTFHDLAKQIDKKQTLNMQNKNLIINNSFTFYNVVTVNIINTIRHLHFYFFNANHDLISSYTLNQGDTITIEEE